MKHTRDGEDNIVHMKNSNVALSEKRERVESRPSGRHYRRTLPTEADDREDSGVWCCSDGLSLDLHNLHNSLLLVPEDNAGDHDNPDTTSCAGAEEIAFRFHRNSVLLPRVEATFPGLAQLASAVPSNVAFLSRSIRDSRR